MANDLYKVQIVVPKYGFLECYYYRIPHVVVGSYLDKFKSDVKQRYPFLDEASFKISWFDPDGDKITIFNEEDFLTLKLLKGRKLYIDVGFNEAREPNITNNPPGKLDECDNGDIRNNPKDNGCFSPPISSNSRIAANISNTLPIPKKVSVHCKSKELTVPIHKINSAKQKEAVEFTVTDDDFSSVYPNNDKFEDTPSRSIIDANYKYIDTYTEDLQRRALSHSSSNTISTMSFSPFTDEIQDKSNDKYSEDSEEGAYCLPLLSDIVLNKSADQRRSSLVVPQSCSAEKKKKAVRFSLPNEYSLNGELFESRNINVVSQFNPNVREDLMYDNSVEHSDPVVQKSLIKLAEMGFCNQGRPFIHLLEGVNGDIIEFFEKYGI